MFHICAKVRQGSGISLTQDFVPGGVDFSQVPKLHICPEIKQFRDLICEGTRAAGWSDVRREGGAS